MSNTTDTARLRELLGAATKGPWEVTELETGGVFVEVESATICRLYSPRPGDEISVRRQNSAAIVAVMNAAPAMLDELDALRARVKREIRTWEVEQEKAQGANGAALEATANLVEVEAERDALRARVADLEQR